MIDKLVFQTSRDVARLRLPAEEARNSFGYYIDIANDWETYRSPEELIKWMGIHSTHLAQFTELTHNLGVLSAEETSWARRYAAFYDSAAQILSTTGFRVDLRYDIAETLCDWRTILKFKPLPARILDFGAGCARQGVAAFLRHPANVYVAVDGTLAGYTIQNLVFGMIDTATGRRSSYDLLDFEAAATPAPPIIDAKPGSRFHVPVWLIEQSIPERYFDVMIAAHVHNELSGYDFMRLLRCIEKGLAADGIAYVRSELHTIDARDFFDAVDLHTHEIVPLLRAHRIVPIQCEHDTFLTTVFAREGSAPHRQAMTRPSGAENLVGAKSNRDMSAAAGERFVEARLQECAANAWRVIAVGEGAHFFEKMIRPMLPRIATSLVVPTEAFVGGDPEMRRKAIEFDADVVIICSHEASKVETVAREMLAGQHFPLRFHYHYPIFFLLRDRHVRRDEIFAAPIFAAAEMPGAAAPRLQEIFPIAADAANAG